MFVGGLSADAQSGTDLSPTGASLARSEHGGSQLVLGSSNRYGRVFERCQSRSRIHAHPFSRVQLPLRARIIRQLCLMSGQPVQCGTWLFTVRGGATMSSAVGSAHLMGRRKREPGVNPGLPRSGIRKRPPPSSTGPRPGKRWPVGMSVMFGSPKTCQRTASQMARWSAVFEGKTFGRSGASRRLCSATPQAAHNELARDEQMNYSNIGATALGFPRIGRNRELKKALDSYWAGRIGCSQLAEVSDSVRRDGLATMASAWLKSIPVNTFTWYDQMLDTVVLTGATPKRFAKIMGEDQLAGFDAARYFAMARGTGEVAPLEMTKWFDTNYHYLVPEIGPDSTFQLNPAKPLAELAEAVALNLAARPVLIGPYTFLSLAKSAEGAPIGFDPLSRLTEVTQVYVQLLELLGDSGAQWVQLDEPALGTDLTAAQLDMVERSYHQLVRAARRPRLLVASYFGDATAALPSLAAAGVDGLALDLSTGVRPTAVAGLPGLDKIALVLGAVNGRNVWRCDLDSALAELRGWSGLGADRSVSTSCSLQHVPYDVDRETTLDPALRATLAFADQKLAEVVALNDALVAAEKALPLLPRATTAFTVARSAAAFRARIPGVSLAAVAARQQAVTDSDRRRESLAERAAAQSAKLKLPLLPTTTIGSFPQTIQIRKARADHRAGRLDDQTYAAAMKDEIRRVIAFQEDLGLDVLVHGEPERNDMVQYFAEQLDGFAVTCAGWVQSYGSRCVRPPILYGDIRRSEPITVPWVSFAQSLTSKPVKGMLTGPVTMLTWSFVREDQPQRITADQVALALRDEVSDLEDAGIQIIQMDEPALREGLPLRRSEQKAYLDWAISAFRLATSGVRTDTQVHTHLCYSEFGEIIDAIAELDADVTSIEAARSRMELLGDIAQCGFSAALGPGVYDIHSPRVPGPDEVRRLLAAALVSLPASRLWVNPDCGLKTRDYAEVSQSLHNMVQAAIEVRAQLPV